VSEHVRRLCGLRNAYSDIQPKQASAAFNEFWICNQIESGQSKLNATVPQLECKVRPNTGGLT
jgi:hypothetical protein